LAITFRCTQYLRHPGELDWALTTPKSLIMKKTNEEQIQGPKMKPAKRKNNHYLLN
jgi:hypothetical protein